MQQTIVVTNTEFYLALESSVRRAMKRFESMAMLPVAERALKDLGIAPSTDAPEGYYHETPDLTRYFRAVRALQDEKNFTKKRSKSVKTLHGLYTRGIFGSRKFRRTALEPSAQKAYCPDLNPVLVSPVVDPITVATMKVVEKSPGRMPWTIKNVMANVPRDLGTCLVGLALLVDESQMHNPVCTTLACETTVLSRAKGICITSVPMPKQVDWQVDKRVEKYGKEVVKGYNGLFMDFAPNLNVDAIVPTPTNVERMLKDVEDIRRCVNIALVDPGGGTLYYHWAVKLQEFYGGLGHGPSKLGEVPTVVEFYSTRIVTTKDYQDDPSVIETARA